MEAKKGDLFKFKNPKDRGFSNNNYFYCRGQLDDDVVLVRSIITQEGEVLIHNEIVDYSHYESDLVKFSIEDFLNEKYNFKEHTTVDFKLQRKYDSGIIREVDNEKKRVLVEVEDEDTAEYKEIFVKFKDIEIVYPEFGYNERSSFNPIKTK